MIGARRLSLLGVATLTVMSTAIVAPALPRMARDFTGVPDAEFLTRMVLTMPAIFIVVCAPLAGFVVDRFGRRKLLLCALALYGAAGMSACWLDDLHFILASRALLGVAIAATMTTTTALVGDYFQGDARSRFTATQSMVMSFGSAVAIMAGGLLGSIDWRIAFLVYGAGWVMLVPAALFLPEPARTAAPAPAARERLPKRVVGLVYAIAVFGVAMFYLVPVQAPFLLRSIGVDSPALAGTAIATTALASAISPFWYARIRRRTGFAGVYATAFGFMAAGYGIVALAPEFTSILAGLAIAGAGVGLFFPNNHLWLLSLAPPTARGRLSGGLTSSVFLGQFFSPLVSQPVVAGAGLVGAYGVFALVLVVVAAGCAWVATRGS